MSRSPNLAELLFKAVDSRVNGLHTAIPAVVTRFDSTQQLIDAQPTIKSSYVDEEGRTVVEQLPVITNVPVQFPGGGGFRLTFPIQAGDTVLLVFSESSLDKWLSQGGVVDPEDQRKHHLSDAIAIPGVHPFNQNWTGVSTTDATIGKDGGPQVLFKSGEIHLGVAVTDAVAMAAKVKTELDALITAFNSHIHSVPGITVGGGTASASPIVVPKTPAAPVGSAIVKIQ